MGKHLFLLLGLLWAQADATWASVINAKVPGKWPAGQITWYYNPAGRPANLGDAEVIAAVSAAFANWKRVCQIEPVYGGTTNVPVDPVAQSTYVVGWTDFGSPQFHAKGVRARLGGTTTYAPLTGGGIQINTSNTDWRGLFDSGSSVGIFHHEIGHTLGLAHSDDPTSIMFANPYNTSAYEMTLQGDDIAACADLYGGKGLAAKPDLRSAVPEPGLVAKVSVLSVKPGSATPTSSLTQIDTVAGGPYYFDRHWEGLAVGAFLEARWVTPNGSVYLRRTFTTTSPNGYRFTTFPDDGVTLPHAGRWAFQLLVDGKLAASTPFEVLRGTVTPVAPFEVATIGEAGTDGALHWRAVTYGNGSVKRLAVIANNKAASGQAFRAVLGDNVAEVWVETDRPRYKLDQDDGQPATSLDAMRTLRFVAGADGLPTTAAVSVSETGTPDAYSTQATVTATGNALQGIYVVAIVNGAVYFRRSGGWTVQAAPLVTMQAPAVVSVDVTRNMDIREFPVGAALFVGFGASIDDLLARRQYALVRQF